MTKITPPLHNTSWSGCQTFASFHKFPHYKNYKNLYSKFCRGAQSHRKGNHSVGKNPKPFDLQSKPLVHTAMPDKRRKPILVRFEHRTTRLISYVNNLGRTICSHCWLKSSIVCGANDTRLDESFINEKYQYGSMEDVWIRNRKNRFNPTE